MKPIKKMTGLMLVLLAIGMIATGFLYYVADELDKAQFCASVQPLLNHSEITKQTLKQ
jgi:Ni,Fe-hydrogenase I cytochrome b subunit